MKRVVALVLTLAVASTLFAFNVFAADERASFVVQKNATDTLLTGVTTTIRGTQFSPVIGEEIVNVSGSPGIRVYDGYTPILVTLKITNSTDNTIYTTALSLDWYLNYDSNFPNGYGISKGIKEIINYSQDLYLTYSGNVTNYLQIVPSTDWSYNDRICLPPHSEIVMISEVRFNCYYMYGSSGYEVRTPTLSSIDLYGTPSATIINSFTPYGAAGGGSGSNYTTILNNIYNVLDSIDGSNASIYSSVDGVEQLLGNLYTQISSIQGNTDDLETYLTNIYGETQDIVDLVDDIESYLSNLNINSDDIVTYIDSIEHYLADILAEDHLTRLYVHDIEEYVNQLEGYLDQVEGYLNNLISNTDNLEGYTDQVEGLLGNIQTLLTWTGNFPVITYSQRKFDSFNGYVNDNQDIPFRIERIYSGSYPVLDTTDFEAPNTIYSDRLYVHKFTYYIRVTNNTGDALSLYSITMPNFTSLTGIRSIEIDSYYSDIFINPYLRLASGYSNLFLYLDSYSSVLPVGNNVAVVYFNVYSTDSTIPTLQDPNITASNLTSYSDDLISQSDDVSDLSDDIHSQEQVWYNQNSQAMESVGLSNYRYSQQQYNGILGVTFQFEQLWNALGSWTLVYIFTLLLSLATFILRHRPTTKMQQRRDENEFWTNTNRSYRMGTNPGYASFVRWRAQHRK